MAKKKRGRGRPPLPKNVKKARAAAGKKKPVKAKAKPKKSAPKKSAPRKASSRRPVVVGDLVASKYLVCVHSQVLRKSPALTAPVMEGQPYAEPLFLAAAEDGNLETVQFFESREAAELTLDRLRAAERRHLGIADAPAMSDDVSDLIGMAPSSDAAEAAHEPPAAAPAAEAPTAAAAPKTLLEQAHVVQAKHFVATSYEIEVNNELRSSIKWKGEATTLGQAVRAVKHELLEHVKTQEKALKEFDRKVAAARKDNLYDVSQARSSFDKFMKVAESYA